jgi:succinate dehydrogenase / fumarate reductase membrane anchor subunit
MTGSLLFYAQRFSAVFLLGYSVWLALFLFLNEPVEYDTWSLFAGQTIFLLLTSAAAFIIVVHSFIGLWTIGTDYFTARTLGFLSPAIGKYANLIRGTYSILFSLWGCLVMFIILFIIWS